jgi:hypothetical protein
MINWTGRLELAKSLHIWLILACFLALFFPSHILWTQCLIASVVWALFFVYRNKNFHKTQVVAILMLLFYLVICTTGIWVADSELFLNSVRMKVILIGMPFCFLVWPYWTKRQLNLFSIGLLFVLAISAIYVLINYVLNHQEILDRILQGQHIPVPFKDHIRYSILLCFGLILSIHQLDRNRKNQDSLRFYGWLFISLILFAYIQFLAVKTGMLISVIVILCFLAYKILMKRLYLKGGIAFLLLLGSVYFMAEYIPTVKNKLAYFSWDIGKYKAAEVKNYSDGERIESIVKGFEIAKANFWLGVGEGNLKLHLTTESKKMPHNQFIVVLAQNGIFGLLSFVAIFIGSIWVSIKKQKWMAFAYTLSMLVANMLEPMLETQLGLTIFSLPLLILHSIESLRET